MVESSRVVETINGGQEWETGRIARADLAGALGVSVEVEWMEPVESSGPWYLIHCEGTRKSVTSETWRNITRLEVIVDLLQRQVRVSPVAGYTVIEGEGEATAVRNPDETPSPPTIREVETGEILWRSISGRRFPTEEEGVSIESWGLADVAPLTRGGEGIGIYADVRFERQMSLRGPLSFIRCGQR